MTTLTHVLADHRRALQAVLGCVAIIALAVSVGGSDPASSVLDSWLPMLGWALIGIGVCGRIWSGSYICGFKNDRLIVEGPYSMCRNPLYLFSFAGGLGVMLTTEMLLFPLLFALAFAVFYPRIVTHEEVRLASLHGAEFDAYRARVPRFWPNPALYCEPVSYTVSAAHFRRHIRDAFWFVMAGGLTELLEALHESGWLPNLVHVF